MPFLWNLSQRWPKKASFFRFPPLSLTALWRRQLLSRHRYTFSIFTLCCTYHYVNWYCVNRWCDRNRRTHSFVHVCTQMPFVRLWHWFHVCCCFIATRLLLTKHRHWSSPFFIMPLVVVVVVVICDVHFFHFCCCCSNSILITFNLSSSIYNLFQYTYVPNSLQRQMFYIEARENCVRQQERFINPVYISTKQTLQTTQ